jgi:hypothetical protein
MPKYVLLLRSETVDYGSWSPEDVQKLIEKFNNWAGRLAAEGQLDSGQKLTDGIGKVITGLGNKQKVTDGPFGETKEVVGGFYIINADNYDHAVELCRDQPNLELGGTVEIREVDMMGQEEG